MRRAILLLLGLLALASPLPAQVVSGTLMEAGGTTPLSGGTMTLLDRDSVAVARLRTDSLGAFSFTLPAAGAYRLRAEHAGYWTATSPALNLAALDTVQVEFRLARDLVVLEPLKVTARSRRLTPAARRFYDRAQFPGSGTFITREQIERIQPGRTTELFNRIPGVNVTPMLGGNNVVVRGDCRPAVYVDGTQAEGYRSIDDLVHPMDLEGVEVYRNSHLAPPEYNGLRAGCAVVLLWTRIE